MKTAVFYEHILEGAKQSGKSVAELMEKCASWNIRGIEIGDALLRENKEEIKELLEKNHMQVSCSNAFCAYSSQIQFVPVISLHEIKRGFSALR